MIEQLKADTPAGPEEPGEVADGTNIWNSNAECEEEAPIAGA